MYIVHLLITACFAISVYFFVCTVVQFHSFPFVIMSTSSATATSSSCATVQAKRWDMCVEHIGIKTITHGAIAALTAFILFRKSIYLLFCTFLLKSEIPSHTWYVHVYVHVNYAHRQTNQSLGSDCIRCWSRHRYRLQSMHHFSQASILCCGQSKCAQCTKWSGYTLLELWQTGV